MEAKAGVDKMGDYEKHKISADRRSASNPLMMFGYMSESIITPSFIIPGEKEYISIKGIKMKLSETNNDNNDSKLYENGPNFYSSWLQVDLLITNFRIALTEGNKRLSHNDVFGRSSVSSSGAGALIEAIPLSSISSVGKSVKGKGENNGGLGRSLICVVSKHGKQLLLSFEKNKRSSSTRKMILERLKGLMDESKVEHLFAFQSNETFQNDGWGVFHPLKELERMRAIGSASDGNWRVTTVNNSFKLCATYPKVLCVPSVTNDMELVQVKNYRSKGRIMVLSWLHWRNSASVSRSSQPLVGVTRKRSLEDEKLMANIRECNVHSETLHIIDARPKINARANQAKGAGSENLSNYQNCTIWFAEIENIHVMRDSLRLLREACSVETEDSKYFSSVENSQWLFHCSKLLIAACKIVSFVDGENSSVLVHCSDGWDRTAQLTALSELMMDPYYRTIEGFEVLIEKEWISFGHRFQTRLGHRGRAKSERSPVFFQFLDCVHQILAQYPCAFQFNEKLLLFLAEESTSCRFGTFLFDCDQERYANDLFNRTPSIWGYVNDKLKSFVNPFFLPVAKVLQPVCSIKKLIIWEEYFFKNQPELSSPGLSLFQRLEEIASEKQSELPYSPYTD